MSFDNRKNILKSIIFIILFGLFLDNNYIPFTLINFIWASIITILAIINFD